MQKYKPKSKQKGKTCTKANECACWASFLWSSVYPLERPPPTSCVVTWAGIEKALQTKNRLMKSDFLINVLEVTNCQVFVGGATFTYFCCNDHTRCDEASAHQKDRRTNVTFTHIHT